MKPYATYKPSGVPWLGDVPGHWDVLSLRHAMDGLAMNGLFKKSEEFGRGTPLVNVSDLFQESFAVDVDSLERVACTPEEIEKYAVQEGDLFLVRSSLKLEGIAQFAVARVVKEPTVFECHIVRIRPDLVLTCPLFLSYYLNAPFARQSLVSRSKTTTMTTIDQNEALSTPMLLPLLDEQRAIAAYLDVEAARIDTLIREKNELMGLLKEWRQSVIAEVVTKGLDKAVATKPSGVPWLGDVPSHWAVEKLKFFVGFAGGGTPSKDNPAYWGGTIPWVSPKDMKRPRIWETEDYITEAGQMNSPCTLIPPMSVLTVVRSGILQHSIPVALNMVQVVLNQDMKALLPSKRVNSRFLAYEISVCQKELREAWVKQGATVESIEHQRMADSELALPPLHEQQAIADFLDAETAKIDDLIAHTSEEITLLKELRAATIADAVLGRVDVRTAAPKQ